MAKIISNRQLIDTPQPAPLRYGLFTVANMREMDVRIIASGLQFMVDHCEPAVTYEQTCAANPVKPITEGSELMGADPYWVLARKRCGSVGRTAAEMQQAVRSQLYTGAQTVVESVLWDGGGLTTFDPALTTSGATIVVPTAAGAGAAIAALEEAFYSVNGYLGTIHINTAGYAALDYANMIVPDLPGAPGILTTSLNSRWSIGAGYGITGPDDVAPAAGFVWAFMTPNVTIWRTDVNAPDPRQTFDRSLNQWDVVAEQVYAHTWDCPNVFAVQVPIAAPAVATAPAPV